jgi:hypothetical protein
VVNLVGVSRAEGAAPWNVRRAALIFNDTVPLKGW